VTPRAPSLLALCVAAVVLSAVPPAVAHGPSPRRTGYVSNVSAVVPNVLGVFVNVVGDTNSLRLSNYSGKEVVVRGDHGEPFLRFARKSIYANLASPTFYVNASRAVPGFAGADAAPRWHKLADGFSYVWRDHRVVWTGIDSPPVVKEQPTKTHLIFNWALPATADRKPFKITGLLGWAPPPGNGGGTNQVPTIAAAVGAALVAAVALGLGVRRLKRRTPRTV
jgi:hypothetical protein